MMTKLAGVGNTSDYGYFALASLGKGGIDAVATFNDDTVRYCYLVLPIGMDCRCYQNIVFAKAVQVGAGRRLVSAS